MLCKECAPGFYRTGCVGTSAGQCVKCQPCLEAGKSRVDCIYMKGNNDRSGKCVSNEVLTNTPICPLRDSIQVSGLDAASSEIENEPTLIWSQFESSSGLRGLSYGAVFGHDNYPFQCSQPCNGFWTSDEFNEKIQYSSAEGHNFTLDTQFCSGPYPCHKVACTMSDLIVDGVAHACPVRFPSSLVSTEFESDSVLWKSYLNADCEPCSTCGKQSDVLLYGYGAGCAGECSQIICDDDFIFDKSSNALFLKDRCKRCADLDDISLCENYDPDFNLPTVVGMKHKIYFDSCMPKSSVNFFANIKYGTCQRCPEFELDGCKNDQYFKNCTSDGTFIKQVCDDCHQRFTENMQIMPLIKTSYLNVSQAVRYLYCQLDTHFCVENQLTGVGSIGVVCSVACDTLRCLDTEIAVQCLPPHQAYCTPNYPGNPDKRIKKATSYAWNFLDVLDEEDTEYLLKHWQRYHSFENIIVDTSTQFSDQAQCCWNSPDILDNVMNPGATAHSFDQTTCLPIEGTKTDLPMLPLQNSMPLVGNVQLSPVILTNSTARVLTYSIAGTLLGYREIEQDGTVPWPHTSSVNTGRSFLEIDVFHKTHISIRALTSGTKSVPEWVGSWRISTLIKPASHSVEALWNVPRVLKTDLLHTGIGEIDTFDNHWVEECVTSDILRCDYKLVQSQELNFDQDCTHPLYIKQFLIQSQTQSGLLSGSVYVSRVPTLFSEHMMVRESFVGNLHFFDGNLRSPDSLELAMTEISDATQHTYQVQGLYEIHWNTLFHEISQSHICLFWLTLYSTTQGSRVGCFTSNKQVHVFDESKPLMNALDGSRRVFNIKTQIQYLIDVSTSDSMMVLFATKSKAMFCFEYFPVAHTEVIPVSAFRFFVQTFTDTTAMLHDYKHLKSQRSTQQIVHAVIQPEGFRIGLYQYTARPNCLINNPVKIMDGFSEIVDTAINLPGTHGMFSSHLSKLLLIQLDGGVLFVKRSGHSKKQIDNFDSSSQASKAWLGPFHVLISNGLGVWKIGLESEEISMVGVAFSEEQGDNFVRLNNALILVHINSARKITSISMRSYNVAGRYAVYESSDSDQQIEGTMVFRNENKLHSSFFESKICNCLPTIITETGHLNPWLQDRKVVVSKDGSITPPRKVLSATLFDMIISIKGMSTETQNYYYRFIIQQPCGANLFKAHAANHDFGSHYVSIGYKTIDQSILECINPGNTHHIMIFEFTNDLTICPDRESAQSMRVYQYDEIQHRVNNVQIYCDLKFFDFHLYSGARILHFEKISLTSYQLMAYGWTIHDISNTQTISSDDNRWREHFQYVEKISAQESFELQLTCSSNCKGLSKVFLDHFLLVPSLKVHSYRVIKPTCPPGEVPTLYRNNYVCMPCHAGTFESEAKCHACSAGKYQQFSGSTSCENCDETIGYFSSTSGATVCSTCLEGKYRTAGVCESCPSNKANMQIVNAHSLEHCLFCQRGFVSEEGEACQMCPVGFSTDIEGGSCVACAAGSYQYRGCPSNHLQCDGCTAVCPGDESLGLCLECPAGYVSTVAARTACHACAPGKFKISTIGTDACQDCAPGKYTQSGQFHEIFGQNVALKSDYFTKMASAFTTQWTSDLNDLGFTDCIDCPAGTYQSTQSTTCVFCENFYSSPAGSFSASACNLCSQSTQFSPNTHTCEPCQYPRPYKANSACSICPEHQYFAAGSCQACASSSVFPSILNDGCVDWNSDMQCGPGYFFGDYVRTQANCDNYIDNHAHPGCSNDPDNLAMFGAEQSLESICDLCDCAFWNQILQRDGQSYACNPPAEKLCKNCLPGTYSSSTTATTCITCETATSANYLHCAWSLESYDCAGDARTSLKLNVARIEEDHSLKLVDLSSFSLAASPFCMVCNMYPAMDNTKNLGFPETTNAYYWGKQVHVIDADVKHCPHCRQVFANHQTPTGLFYALGNVPSTDGEGCEKIIDIDATCSNAWPIDTYNEMKRLFIVPEFDRCLDFDSMSEDEKNLIIAQSSAVDFETIWFKHLYCVSHAFNSLNTDNNKAFNIASRQCESCPVGYYASLDMLTCNRCECTETGSLSCDKFPSEHPCFNSPYQHQSAVNFYQPTVNGVLVREQIILGDAPDSNRYHLLMGMPNKFQLKKNQWSEDAYESGLRIPVL